jgi:AcrR family transcriptional regulator
LEKKHEILDAAFRLFCAKGYHLSMSEIAKAVSLRTPSLYSHFESKEEIVERMVRAEIDRYYSNLKTAMAAAECLSCRDAMKNVYLSVFEYFREYDKLRFWRSMPLIPNEHLRSTFRQLIGDNDRIYTQKMKECFDKGIERGEIKPDVSGEAIYLYLSMVQGVLDGMLLYPKSITENEFAEKVFEAYWQGIRVAPQGS